LTEIWLRKRKGLGILDMGRAWKCAGLGSGLATEELLSELRALRKDSTGLT
jgi:hypothetical protein